MPKFLHLSDIHFSVFDGNPDHDLEARVRDLMLDDIAAMHARVGDIDGVLVVGDIANKGQEGEYSIASEFLDRVCELTNCPKEHTICVPGNHDIDRDSHDAVHLAVRDRLHALAPERVSDELLELLQGERGAEVLLSPLSAYNQFALRYECDIGRGHLTWKPKTFQMGERPVVVYGITSPWISDARDSDKNDEEKVVIGAFQCGQLAQPGNQVSVVMFHHPLNWVRDAREVEPWINRAALILTGHEHESGIMLDAARQRVVLASGAVNPSRTLEGWIPAYNVIELQLSDHSEEELEVTVHVRNWQGTVAKFGPDERFADPYDLTIDLRSEPHSGEQPVEELPETLPTPEPEPIDSEAHSRVFRIMRAAPDVRHRVAGDLGLTKAGDLGGLALDRAILRAAMKQDRLGELDERIANE
jgi:predicted phosphodiesterase